LFKIEISPEFEMKSYLVILILITIFTFSLQSYYSNQIAGNIVSSTADKSIKSRPNVVVIITDDQGYGDVARNKNPALYTPNIDQLAEQSVRFSNFHVDPTCSPTRAALLTGKYSMRAGVWHTVMGRSFLASKEVTIAEMLGNAGYDTAIFGKWHLGDNYPFRPQDHGFQHSVIHGGGGVGQSGDFWGNTQFDDFYFRNGKPEYFAGYATTTWFDEAISFIRHKAKSDKPFFTLIATNAPHAPYRAYEKDIQVYRDKGLPEKMARFYAMISDVDKNVGRVRQELKSLGIDKQTVLIFMTDNGSSLMPRKVSSRTQNIEQLVNNFNQQSDEADWMFNAGLRGFKASVYEGGHHVPFYISYPAGDFGEPRDISDVTAHFDLVPTLVELTGIETTLQLDLDGVSLMPLLTQNGPLESRKIVVTNQRIDIPRIGRPSVVLDGDWRFVSELDNGIEELYNLSLDPKQANNVILSQPKKAQELRASLQEWWSEVSKDVGRRVRPIVGSKFENPSRLNANDWMEAKSTADIAWNPAFKTLFLEEKDPGWIGYQQNFSSLPWHVEVAKSGQYEISLYFHDIPAQQPVDRDVAILELNGNKQQVKLQKGAAGALFKVSLDKGPLKIKGWFANEADANNSQIPAFYAYVESIL
jgi:arylsulfatase A-like enzyme